MPHLRTCLAATAAALASTAAMAAQLPVKIERFEGEVVQVIGTVHSGVLPGKNLEQGTQIQTGADGRAELSLSGATTVAVGGGSDLLVHSVEQGVLRLRLASGAVRIDARAAGPHQARDVRLNVGDLRLRISGADAWTELGDRGGQVCLIAGVIDAQQQGGAVRLDAPGQCLRQSGLTAQWSMVPLSVLEERVAQVAVSATAVAAAPRPEPKIRELPLPIAPEPEPAPKVVIVEPPPAIEAPKPAAAAPAAIAKEEAVAAAPVPAPVKDPEMPLAAPIVAMAVPAPVEAPALPDPPAVEPRAPIADPVASAPTVPSRPRPTPLPADPTPAEPAVTPAQPAVPEAPAAAQPAGEVEPVKAGVQQDTEVAMAAPVTAALVIDDGRRWRVVVGSMPEFEKAEAEAERLNARGWVVEAREYRVGDRHGYRIGFGQFAAREEAQKALDEFVAQYPDAAAWLAKY